MMVPKDEDPYRLHDGTYLSFRDIPSLFSKLVDEEKIFKVAIVYGSGVWERGQHAGWATDLLYVPEIICELVRWAEDNRIKITIKSRFDIDILPDYIQDPKVKEACEHMLKDFNIISVGDGRVNAFYAKIMRYYQKNEKCKVKAIEPNTGGIVSYAGVRRRVYPLDTEADCGLLTMLVNPWSEGNRVIIICAGNTAAGTVAALKLLYLMLCDRRYRENNRYDERIPAKVVDAILYEYYKNDINWRWGMYIGDVRFVVRE